MLIVLVLGGTAAASDLSTAKTLVVTSADVGKNYTVVKAAPSTDIAGPLASCMGKPVSERQVTATVDGLRLTNQQDGSVISSTVQFLKTAAMAEADRAVAADPKFPDCLQQVIQEMSASQGVTSVTASGCR